MRTTTNYVRLSDTEREEISRGIAAGQTLTYIAYEIGRATSTVSREVGGGHVQYRASSSSHRARKRSSSRRKGKGKIATQPRLRVYILSKLRLRWSPDQIAKRIRAEYPMDMTMRISAEAIYQYIYVFPRGELRRTLVRMLRQQRVWRHKRGQGRKTRSNIADMLSIEERPAEVADRTVPGHWEGDLIMGTRRRSGIGTLVERTTRYTILVPLHGQDTKTVREAYARATQTIPKELRRTLTYDQGREMCEHLRFTETTGMQVYFAHPGSPWERGTNENTNGLIRQYFPKGTDFRTISVRELKRVQRELNNRPRRALNYRTPDEVFTSIVALKG